MERFINFTVWIFNKNSGCCNPFRQTAPPENSGRDELLDEVRKLRREVEELREKQQEEH